MKKFFGILLLLFPLLVFGFEAGRDYLELPTSRSTQAFNPPNKVTVVEFFSYGCPACNRFDPTLESWLKQKHANVNFQRIPVEFESDWHLYARTYYAAEALGIQSKVSPEIFNAIHKDHLDLGTPERMADFFQKHFNIKSQEFLDTLSSPAVAAELAKNQMATNDFMIFQVPGIVIDGKYKVDPSLAGNNPQRLIETMDFLIKKEKAAKKI